MARDTKLEEAADKLGKSAKTLRRWCAKEGAPHERGARRCYLVDPAELRAWDKQRRAERAEARRRQRAAAVARAEDEPASAEAGTPAVEAEPPPEAKPAPAEAEPTPAEAEPPPAKPVADAELAAPPPAPPRAARRPRRAPQKESGDPEPPEAAKLRLAAELSRLAGQAAGLRLTRVPGLDDRPDDLAVLADSGAALEHSVSATEFAAVAETGGLLPYARERLGPGHYAVAWVSPSLVELHRERLEVPSLKRLAFLRRIEVEAAERERNAARRRRKEREAERARARRRAAREAAERAWFERERRAWTRAWTDAALVEAGFRLRYVRDMLYDLGQREEARRRRLERQGADPGPAPRAALLDVLARILRTDLRDVARAVAEVLDERAELFPAPVGHPVVLAVVERVLPRVPDGRFGPWLWLAPLPPAWAPPPRGWPGPPPPPSASAA